jgi:DNA-binding winged helix-turn-helix (wHTH) protein/TolB-like protein
MTWPLGEGLRVDQSTPDATGVQSIDLAREPDFDLGSLRVRPARCEVGSNGVTETIQRRVMQVLVALVHARGSVVSQEDLINLCWRGLSVTDDAIVRCISKLRKLAAARPDAPYAIETIPGVGYRLTSPSLPSAPPREARSRRRIWGLAAALAGLVLLVSSAIWIARRPSADEQSQVRVVVQPFEALSDSEASRAMARRISNEVVNELGDSQVEAVMAGGQAGTTSPRPGLVVTGIVHGDAPTTSVNVRIEDGLTNEALWAMEFKRDSREASDLPLEIAARIADEANMVMFARGAKPSLADNSALSALLQVTDMIRDPPNGAWAQMIERARALVARHPEFAFGHDVLAVAYAEAASQAIDAPDRSRAMTDAALREANLTLKLDPEDAGAYVVLSDLQPDYAYRAREAILLRGLKIAKHPKEPLGGLYSTEGRLLDNVGRLREALALKLVAQAADEWGAPKTAQLARAYGNIGDLAAARTWLQKGVQLWPNHSGVRRVRQYVAGFYELPAEALAVFDSLDAQPSSDESNAIWRIYVEARRAHSPATTMAAIDHIRGAADQDKLPRETEIMMIAGLGEAQQAMEAANAVLDRQALQTWFLFTPVTRNIRQNPGFVALAQRTGLIQYWHDTGRLPDFCTDPASRSDCSPQLRAAIKA